MRHHFMYIRKKNSLYKVYLFILIISFCSACNDSSHTTNTESGTESGTPAGTESGTPAGTESGTPAGTESGTSAGTESGTPAGTESGIPAGTESGIPAGTESGTQTMLDCDPIEVLANNSCSQSGCHATPIQAQLDLASPGFESSLINAPSVTPGCEGRVLIDPQTPSRSLLLQAVGAEDPPLGEQDSCQIRMPPSGDISVDDQTCFSDWVAQLAAEHQAQNPELNFEAMPVYSVLRKIKTLVYGGAPTQEEYNQVLEDVSNLPRLIELWLDTDKAEKKLLSFFKLSLQQKFLTENMEQFGNFRRHPSFNRPFITVLEESIPRTALELVKNNQPFNQIATTQTWWLTTANLILLSYTHQSIAQASRPHSIVSNPADSPGSLAQQIATRTWYLPAVPGNCELLQRNVLSMLFGFIQGRDCAQGNNNFRFSETPLQESDFNDWRPVNIIFEPNQSDEDQVPFYDVVQLREMNEIRIRTPRLGFFTSSVFFNNWSTNVDNQFRVTTNQSLLGALHVSFSSTEPTEPVSLDGLDADHASDESCYGCHRQLDPMRVYFAKHFNVNYQNPLALRDFGLIIPEDTTPSFAFQGVTDEGGDLYRFGEILAQHPRFAPAWVQKLCLYINSTRCDESDPEFVALSERFIEQNFNLKQLFINFLVSPLVTHQIETQTLLGKDPLISITRRQHLCSLLEERLRTENICESQRIPSILGLVPQDNFARGIADFTQATAASAFYYAAIENLCEIVARGIVTADNEYYSFREQETTLSRIVREFMAILPDDPRYETVLQILTQHVADARAEGQNLRDATRSAFSLACVSPDVMGVGL